MAKPISQKQQYPRLLLLKNKQKPINNKENVDDLEDNQEDNNNAEDEAENDAEDDEDEEDERPKFYNQNGEALNADKGEKIKILWKDLGTALERNNKPGQNLLSPSILPQKHRINNANFSSTTKNLPFKTILLSTTKFSSTTKNLPPTTIKMLPTTKNLQPAKKLPQTTKLPSTTELPLTIMPTKNLPFTTIANNLWIPYEKHKNVILKHKNIITTKTTTTNSINRKNSVIHFTFVG